MMNGKWKILIECLPYMLGMLGMKYVISEPLGYPGMIDFSDVALVLTGGIFLIGFMLAGTMADYKESEKIPGDLASIFETFEESIHQGVNANKTPIEKKIYMTELRAAIDAVMKWLLKKLPQEEMYAALSRLGTFVCKFEKEGVNGGLCGKMLGDIHNVRKLVTRVGVISRTGFLATGYALLEVLIACIIAVLMIAKFKNLIAEMIIVAFVTLIYVYMYKLIKDVDDPFEYDPDGETGVSEIPLFPMEEYIERLEKRIADGN